MPLGILNDSEFEAELNNTESESDLTPKVTPDNLALIIPPAPRGRGADNVDTPESLRNIIGEEKLLGAKSKELQELFAVKPSTVNVYAHGATSGTTYNTPNEKLSKHLNYVKENIVRRASGKLKLALSEITADKLSSVSAKEASAVAKDMSAIIRNLEPPTKSEDDRPNVQFQFFAPIMKKESDYVEVEVVEDL